jgi:hypothetical protein
VGLAGSTCVQLAEGCGTPTTTFSETFVCTGTAVTCASPANTKRATWKSAADVCGLSVTPINPTQTTQAYLEHPPGVTGLRPGTTDPAALEADERISLGSIVAGKIEKTSQWWPEPRKKWLRK